MKLEGKVAAITGAGSGIGRQLALQLSAKHCELSLTDIVEKNLVETVGLCKSAVPGVKISWRVLDVSKRDDVYAWADFVKEEHGKADLIFNNAGVAGRWPIEDVSYEDFEWIMNIDFWGVVYGTKAFLPLLKERSEAYIINISSLFGLVGVYLNGPYCAAKFAVRGFTESLKQELEYDYESQVRVLCVHPGGIKTAICAQSKGPSTSTIRNPVTAKVFGKKIGETLTAQEIADNFERACNTTAESCASQILHAVQKNRSRLLVGIDAKGLDLVARCFPQNYHRLMKAVADGTALKYALIGLALILSVIAAYFLHC